MPMKTPEIPVEIVTVIELPADELHAPSGLIDSATGREVTNYEFIADFEARLHGGEVFLNANGRLSEEAKQHNARLHNDPAASQRQRAGGFMIAVLARRPLKG
jgi:hypothetical protein